MSNACPWLEQGFNAKQYKNFYAGMPVRSDFRGLKILSILLILSKRKELKCRVPFDKLRAGGRAQASSFAL